MPDREVLTLKASKHNEVAKYSKVINKEDLEYFIWVEMNPEEMYNCYLYRVDEVSNPGQEVFFADTFIKESNKWMKVKVDVINNSAGYHQYRLCFVDKCTDETFSRYFSYTIQDDNVDKPYIYMDRSTDTTE